ncbi:carboxypeptidase-like regulatory domain-containing protein [Terracidiphilus gabretensis]|uniref:carboxypeptidase-like regulatory domain-containing protein n=1 Tax=Terracidiphilus gabretensis TaxID=1577687 RepID=UPI001E589547|nr:carboxypeptidase-like regulatory domain-containing protein [Terracidiphilus gabretensis]
MRYSIRSVASLLPRLLVLIVAIALSTTLTLAQQTLGGITGSVSDASGGVIPNATVTVVSEQTSLTRTVKTNAEGEYNFVNLPIGTYTLTFTADGFDIQKSAHINVQADRTISLNAQLKVAAAKGETIEVDATPLMNAVDTTVGYVLDNTQLNAIPLPTGSFTGAAILTPGVNAELSGGTGANSGLGNQPIWANGQRDSSNSFSLNGVDSTNLFNGKSTSQVGSARVINSTGSSGGGGGGVIQSVASVYLSIGNAIPTPAPESLQEVKVNASMYDATQGSTSGAHIDLNTASGTNKYHGGVYYTRGTNWINAAPFFFKQDADVPAAYKNPDLHRNLIGGTFGGPIIKDKLFGFLSYQHLSVADQEIGDGFLDVPVGLSQCTTRDASCLTGILNNQYSGENWVGSPYDGTAPFTTPQINPMALQLFNLPSVPGEPGKYLIPDDQSSSTLGPNQQYNSFLPGTGRFKADLAVAGVDWNASSKDTLALKYFYQHDPTLAPYSYSSVPGFTEHLDSGAQVFSIINSYIIKSNLSTTQTLGFIREKIYATNEQPWGPNNMPSTPFGTPNINMFGSTYFPGVSIVNVLGATGYAQGTPSTGILNIGPNAEGQAPNTGMFQNRIAPSGNAIWMLGKHTLSFGAGYTYTQLNTIDKRTNAGTIASDDFSAFAQGFVSPGSGATGFYVTSFLQGNANRYYRANQLGMYVQDKYQITPTLSLTAGLRYDWDGGFTEKYGRIFNFDPGTSPDNCTQSTSDPNAYSYCTSSDTILNPGLIIAGNNANGTHGISNTTLTGRQWGMAPRVGAAWQPGLFHNKLVVRAGGGFYYDRGELFSYFSPGYALGTVTGGPFGVNQQLPFVNVSQCPAGTQSLYNYYIPTCGGENTFGPPLAAPTDETGDLANPYGTSKQFAAPNNPKATDLSAHLPNACSIANTGLSGIPGICPNTPNQGEIVNNGVPISLGVYDRANKLPYTVNYTLDLQWQPRNDLAIELGYIGNLSRHQVIPVPMNQANIASPTSPFLGGGTWQQNYSYGYTVGSPATLPDGTGYMANAEGGNVDLRVPYIGYAAESIKYVAAGIGAYNALQAHIEKRMSKSFQIGASYTYSHATDEQSGLGLFYNGNNALDLRSGYGLADFDRTHVLNFNYIFQVPNMAPKNSLLGKFVDDWSLTGITVLQSGQPYSIIDFSGAIGSIYYSTFDGITNPIVPLAKGCSAKSAKTGHSGAFYPINGYTALNPSCFTLPLLAPGSLGSAIPTSDPYETGFTSGQRNIFRQSFQKRADASLGKSVNFKDKVDLKFTLDVFNLSNTPSFDIPGNEVAQNLNYNNFPSYLPPGQSPLPTGCSTSTPASPGPGGLYYCPQGLGIVQHTIGSGRQVQMSLNLKF